MTEIKEYLIGMFDVLGFESLFHRLGLEEIYRRDEILTAHVREPKSGYDLVPIGGFVAIDHIEVQHASFSDTILYPPPSSFPTLRFCITCCEVLSRAVEIGSPSRGGFRILGAGILRT